MGVNFLGRPVTGYSILEIRDAVLVRMNSVSCLRDGEG
jgi:hypothetical protein